MLLKSRITDDMKDAMRAKDAARLSAIRMLLAAIKQREIDERIELTDADVLAIIEKMIKQRKDSITQFEAGRREDLAAVERAEVAVLQVRYLPAQPTDGEIDALIAEADRRHGRCRDGWNGEGHGPPQTAACRPSRLGAVSAEVKARLA